MEIATSFTIEQYRISESSPPKKKKVKPRNLDSWVYIYSERRKGATHQKKMQRNGENQKGIMGFEPLYYHDLNLENLLVYRGS